VDINVVSFGAAHYAVLAGIIFLSYLWGGILLERLIPDDTGARYFLNTAAGLGILIVFLFYSALSLLLYPTVVACFLCLSPAYFIYRKNYSIITPRTTGADLKISLTIGTLTVLLLTPILLLPLFPPTMWDEISYHLPYARYYVQNHGLVVNQNLRYPLYSHNIDLLYSLALLFYDDILAHLFHTAAALLTTAGIYYLGKETHSKVAGVLAASIFLSSKAVLVMMKTSYIDLGLTLFVFFAFFCVAKWSLTREDRWLYLAGFAVGIALGSKYSGFFYLSLLTVWVVLDARKLGPAAKFILPAIIFGSPWYIRNFFISGDPLSPFGGNTFGFWLWNKNDLIGQGRDLLIAHGTPKTFLSLLKLPWNLVFHDELYFQDGISPGILALYPCFFFFRWLSPFYRKVALYVLLNILFWFFSTQIVRYLLPTLPMMALLSSVSLLKLIDLVTLPITVFLSRHSQHTLYASRTAIGVPIILATSPFVFIDYKIFDFIKYTPVPVTENQRVEYLTKRIPAYAMLQIANKKPDSPIYQLGFEDTFYFAQGKMMGDWFGPSRYEGIIDSLSDPQKLHGVLKAQQAKQFLFNKNRGFKFIYGPNFAPYLTKVAETKDASLFDIKM
jgi:hypothetical protein